MSVDTLSRIQFALTIGFHYLYPVWSIGLSLFLLFIEGQFLRTKDERYKRIAQYWVKIFGLTFAVGVATGLVQVFEFGTNWAGFSRYVGDVFGAMLGSEGIFAFLLESGFLAILLFGWNRVGPKMHFFSTLMVAIGAHFSAFWIVAANSWMQTPAGFHIVGEGLAAHAEVSEFWTMIFNPSFLTRLGHVLIGAWMTGAFLVISISAYYLYKQRNLDLARVSMKLGLCIAVVMVCLQLWSADSSARGVVEHQPPKLAAMEGVFESTAYAPFTVLGWVDLKERKVVGIKIPWVLSILSYHDPSAVVEGLDSIPEEDWPYSPAIFQLYRAMIYSWGLMFLTAFLGWIFWKRIKEGRAKPLLWLMMISVIFPQIANQAGWFTAEMGRQPWVVYGHLRRSDALSEVISANQVLGSVIMFALIYLLLFVLFCFLLDRKIKAGPATPSTQGA